MTDRNAKPGAKYSNHCPMPRRVLLVQLFSCVDPSDPQPHLKIPLPQEPLLTLADMIRSSSDTLKHSCHTCLGPQGSSSIYHRFHSLKDLGSDNGHNDFLGLKVPAVI